jgi:hypothetical protein
MAEDRSIRSDLHERRALRTDRVRGLLEPIGDHGPIVLAKR